LPGATKDSGECVLEPRQATLLLDSNTEPASSDPDITPIGAGRALAWMTSAEYGRALWVLDALDGASLLWEPAGQLARAVSPRTQLLERASGWLFSSDESASAGDSALGAVSMSARTAQLLVRARSLLRITEDAALFLRTLVRLDDQGASAVEARELGAWSFESYSLTARTGSSLIISAPSPQGIALWRITEDGTKQKLRDTCDQAPRLVAHAGTGVLVSVPEDCAQTRSLWRLDEALDVFGPVDEPGLRDLARLDGLGQRGGRTWFVSSAPGPGPARLWTVDTTTGDIEELSALPSIIDSAPWAVSRAGDVYLAISGAAEAFTLWRSRGTNATTEPVPGATLDSRFTPRLTPFDDGVVFITHALDEQDQEVERLLYVDAQTTAPRLLHTSAGLAHVVTPRGTLVILDGDTSELLVLDDSDALLRPLDLGDDHDTLVSARIQPVDTGRPGDDMVALSTPGVSQLVDVASGRSWSVARAQDGLSSDPRQHHWSQHFAVTDAGVFAWDYSPEDQLLSLSLSGRTSLEPTVLVSFPALGAKAVARPHPMDRGLWFALDDGVHGREAWYSDGTPEGTRLVTDASPHTGDTLGVISTAGALTLLSVDGELQATDPGTSSPELPCARVDPMPTAPRGSALLISTRTCASSDATSPIRALDGSDASPRLLDDDICSVSRLETLPSGRTVVFGRGCSSADTLHVYGVGADSVERLVDPVRSKRIIDDSTAMLEDGRLVFQVNDTFTERTLWITDGTSAGTHELAQWSCDKSFGGLQLEGVWRDKLVVRNTPRASCEGDDFGSLMALSLDPRTPTSERVLVLAEDAKIARVRINGKAVYYEVREPSMLVRLDDLGGYREIPMEDTAWFAQATGYGPALFAMLPRGGPDGSARFVWFDGLRRSDVTSDLGLPRGARVDPGINVNAGNGHAVLHASTGPDTGVIILVDLRGEDIEVIPSMLPRDERYQRAFGNLLVFVHQDDAHGRELWVSDGTSLGTRMLTDIWPGSMGSYPVILGEHEGLLYFAASDPEHGDELWVTAGTPATTQLVADIWPGPRSSHPADLVSAPGRFFVTATDATHGREHWELR